MRVWMLPLGLSFTLAPLLAAEEVPPNPTQVARPSGPTLIVDDVGRSLFDLIQEGDAETIAAFLEAHPGSINQTNATGETPLMVAITRSHWEIGQILLDHGADVNALNRRKQTPLILTAIQNNLPFLLALIDKNADTARQDFTGQTALHYVTRAGNASALSALLSHGADISKVEASHGYTPVALALADGHDALAQEMIAAQITETATPLFYYIRENRYLEFVQRLETHPNDIDNRIAGGWSLLHEAVLDNRIDMVNYVLEHGFDPVARDCGHRTALHVAAMIGDADMVMRMIEAHVNLHVDLKVIDDRGLTPLSLGIRSHNRPVVEALLLNGADPNVLDIAGRTPAFELATCDDAMAALLIRQGIHLNVRDPLGRTPLYSALNNPKRVQLLIASGAAINPKDKNGLSLLHEAAIHAPADVILQLVRAGVPLEEPDNQQRTALHYAVLRNNPAAVKALVEAGCNLNARDRSGDTPLHYAVYSLTVTALLLERHALCDIADANEKMTPLNIANLSGDPEARALLQAHLDMLDAAKKGDLPALQAVYATLEANRAAAEKAGHPDAAKVFTAAPASVNNTRNHDGATPLMLAALAGNKPIVAALIQAGADPSARDLTGATPFIRAANTNQVAILQFLLTKKVDLNAINLKQRNALHKAAQSGSLDAVKFLLTTSIERENKDFEGHTPLDLAKIGEHADVVALLTPAPARNDGK